WARWRPRSRTRPAGTGPCWPASPDGCWPAPPGGCWPAPPGACDAPGSVRGVPQPLRLVVLASGAGTTLLTLLDAWADPSYGVVVAGVGSDRDSATALHRATVAGVPTFVCRPADHPDRASWDRAITDAV